MSDREDLHKSSAAPPLQTSYLENIFMSKYANGSRNKHGPASCFAITCRNREKEKHFLLDCTNLVNIKVLYTVDINS